MLITLLLAAAVQAAPTPSLPPATEKPICRREIPMGSNMMRKVCHTRAEWARIDGENASASEQALRQRVNRLGSNSN
ncbi:hypothetical protein [uncultured Sphingomonas sp.]|uniref:hypothetical protein n=1 Tax=uncultured Sphingomonas sp. TaxID=158754 RepID=UPI0025FF62D6|nr:hypothetical protein [uncultured Sphingomonas sp.]